VRPFPAQQRTLRSVEVDMSVELQRRRFTVEDFLAMAEAGILGEDERVELIEGDIIDMPPIGSPHASCVDRLNHFIAARAAGAAIIRVQNPVWISDLSLPQPDLALLRPKGDFYKSGHPRPADTLLVVEVAHTTLSYDRGVKLPLYAAASIPEVWIVDIEGHAIEVYRDPKRARFTTEETLRRGAKLNPSLLPSVTLLVEEILG
jgi:Uma2 family endonuclease